eukprot:gnl/MRDRNA2_/MRDRNA2_96835_c0_seq1.p1 gnl/MRDRNA2_/MRDRNA2_96835_c0~~gnl/MRDRNA2_/MRDRNA2_96835_c0_seq1.p1  ORF type:complete len:108 (-),score=31.84 gnl/MRDRNA2_/MRDRNA2_96835_c0_seq1:165-449(-)
MYGPPSCEEIIAMADLWTQSGSPPDGKVAKAEWSSAGNCYDPDEFDMFDIVDPDGDELTVEDCEALGADLMGILGEKAMNPMCGGPVHTDMGPE